MYKHNIEVRAYNHCCRKNNKNITYSECLSEALFIQHEMRMRLILLSFLACLILSYFSTLSHKR